MSNRYYVGDPHTYFSFEYGREITLYPIVDNKTNKEITSIRGFQDIGQAYRMAESMNKAIGT